MVTTITHQSRLSAVVALSENRVIGRDNQLPWRLPADLKHFKKLTLGHPIIMGRKTYVSIGKPLPQRTNIVLTQEKQFQAPGCIVIHSLDEAIKKGAECDSDIFIIGGAQLYRQSLPLLQFIYMTIIHQHIEGDTFFPELQLNEWKEIAREDHSADSDNPLDYSFVTLERL